MKASARSSGVRLGRYGRAVATSRTGVFSVSVAASCFRKLERSSMSTVEGKPRNWRALRRAREARHLSSSQRLENGGLDGVSLAMVSL
jgi:hypothetical protein